jgi:hypothetical protein
MLADAGRCFLRSVTRQHTIGTTVALPCGQEVVAGAMLHKFAVMGQSAGTTAPGGVVRRPRRAGLLAFAICAPCIGSACATGAADQITPPVDLAMTSGIAPYYSDGSLTLYEVEVPVALPVRRMTGADMRAIGGPPQGSPYPSGVFLRAEDERVEVHFTLSNLDDKAQYVWLLIDPWNEFVRWRPGVTVVDDENTIPNWGYDQEFVVPAKGKVEGTLTPDDMREIAIKLASAENLLASPQAQAPAMTPGAGFDATSIANNIFNPQNRSNSGDPLYTPWIPPVVAGLTGFDLGLRTSQAANVTIEITMEVQDLRGDRFVLQDSSDPKMGVPPMVLSPPSARF